MLSPRAQEGISAVLHGDTGFYLYTSTKYYFYRLFVARASHTYIVTFRSLWHPGKTFFIFYISSGGWGKISFGSPHFHVFSYASCVDSTTLFWLRRIRPSVTSYNVPYRGPLAWRYDLEDLDASPCPPCRCPRRQGYFFFVVFDSIFVSFFFALASPIHLSPFPTLEGTGTTILVTE